MKSPRSPKPFDYPEKPLKRRHAPRGYKRYGQYRPWLRDEFCFRCVYCMKRETWNEQRKEWHLDHFIPQAEEKALRNDYDNLVYSCPSCNMTKRNSRVPDPFSIAYGKSVEVCETGEIRALDKNGKRLIGELGLDDEDYTRMRRKFISLMRACLANRLDEQLHQFFGYPENMPDLSNETPPDGNENSESENQSFFARRATLPAYF